MNATRIQIFQNIQDFPDFVERPLIFETNSGYLDYWLPWFRQNWSTAFLYVAIYLLVIAILKRYMENKEKFELQSTIAAWNFALAIFSILGTVRTLPELVRLLSSDGGFRRSACDAK